MVVFCTHINQLGFQVGSTKSIEKEDEVVRIISAAAAKLGLEELGFYHVNNVGKLESVTIMKDIKNANIVVALKLLVEYDLGQMGVVVIVRDAILEV